VRSYEHPYANGHVFVMPCSRMGRSRLHHVVLENQRALFTSDQVSARNKPQALGYTGGDHWMVCGRCRFGVDCACAWICVKPSTTLRRATIRNSRAAALLQLRGGIRETHSTKIAGWD
jgi:hypothetical protein